MYVALLFLALVLSLGYFQGQMVSELLAVGSGFTATAVCYGHFVSHRDVWTVVTNELAGIPSYLTSFEIDDKNEFVIAYPKIFATKQIASSFGASTTAYYLGPDLGCRLSSSPDDSFRVKEIMTRGGSMTRIVESPMVSKKSAQLQLLLDYEVSVDAATTNQTRAIVVLHHGNVVGEAYQTHLGISRDTPLLGWSMTKSVQSMLVFNILFCSCLHACLPACI